MRPDQLDEMQSENPRTRAAWLLCGLQVISFRRQLEETLLPGYVGYLCPRCSEVYHQMWDSPRSRELLTNFPGIDVIERTTDR